MSMPHPNSLRSHTPKHPIRASAGGKLQEKIVVVQLVSANSLVLSYLNAPLPPRCALTPESWGLWQLFFSSFFFPFNGISIEMYFKLEDIYTFLDC